MEVHLGKSKNKYMRQQNSAQRNGRQVLTQNMQSTQDAHTNFFFYSPDSPYPLFPLSTLSPYPILFTFPDSALYVPCGKLMNRI